ncbi:MAG: MATE family efflux transporter, partial [Pedobacter sp.]
IQAVRIVSSGYIFYGAGMVLISAFNGAGDTKIPTLINLVCFWFFQVPFAWLLAKTAGIGPIGVFMAIPIAETIISIIAFILFRKGKWKLKQI